MGDPEQNEAGIDFLSPPTAVPSSRRHLLLDDTAVRRPFNETEKATEGDETKTKSGQDPEDAEKPEAVAATLNEKGPPTNQLKVLLSNQARQDREMAAMRAASERQRAQIQQMLQILQAQAENASERKISTDYSEHAPIRFRVWGVALRMFLK